jgi:conjugative transposon TraN protein
MKHVITVIVMCVVMFQAKSQSISQLVIKSYPTLAITNTKTTSLVFPQSIQYADRGTNEILTQQVKGAANVLLLKAAKVHFKETNLSVLTTDGKLYSFKVEYDSLPTGWVYYFKNSDTDSIQAASNINNEIASSDIVNYSRALLLKNRKVHGVANTRWSVSLILKGVYIKNDLVFFQLGIKNASKIDYDVDFIKFYIRDMKQSRRTSFQEIELKPLFVSGDIGTIRAKSRSNAVIALQKFTIPDAKYLTIEVQEKNGGRHLRIRTGNYKITKAIALK